MLDPTDWQQLAAQVRAWIDDDPDPDTRAELAELLRRAEGGRAEGGRADARTELADRFSGPLQFGTAGLRGQIGGGPHRMNRAVVIRTACGLAAHLHGVLAGQRPAPRVVVGYDARHKSREFAVDTVAVLTAAGIEAFLLPDALPTPVLAFAVRHLDADAGVMVTASHNPPRDNGYKVYLGGRVESGPGQGAQLVPPTDAAIAAQIARVRSVAAVPRADHGWTVLGPELVDAYVVGVLALAEPDPDAAARAGRLRLVLTPMHGVGGATASRILRAAGFTDLHVVPEQAEPDPDFPTVAFPNPEEPGAVDLALARARAVGADLVVALDPDADRCAVAVVDTSMVGDPGSAPAAADGWRMLHGDEVGALLGALVADRLRGSDAVLASSIVSSRQLARIAAEAGLRHAETLTGFKWLSRVPGLAFAYEEALGYCVDPAHVRDKDGMSAALLVAGLAARLAQQGRTLMDALDDLARRHGLYLSTQLAARFEDLDLIRSTTDRLRNHPPAALAGSPVVEVVDLAAPRRDGVPPTDGLRLLAADDTRVVVRPSGTEPKVKCYLEVVEPVAADADAPMLQAARRRARSHLAAVRTDMAAALGL